MPARALGSASCSVRRVQQPSHFPPLHQVRSNAKFTTRLGGSTWLIFGYAYPAYECYKTVELNKPEIEQLRFWCQYWILVALLTVSERIGDAFISWLPMYSEAKLAFFIYLWYPKTKGTTYVYDSFFRPYVAKHENEIDRNLLELKTGAGDMAIVYWQRAVSYCQTRVFEILHYVAAQSTPTPRAVQQQQGPRGRQAPIQPSNLRNCQSSVASKEEPPSPTSSTSLSQHHMEVDEDVGSQSLEAVSAAAGAPNPPRGPPTTPKAPNISRSVSVPSEPTNVSVADKTEGMQIEAAVLASSSEDLGPKETVMDEAIRVTRGRLRKTRSVAK
ncbi:HVA22-like protein i [Linum perenne]